MVKKIISDKGDIEITKPEDMKDAIEKLGVPFSCEDGVCGTCLIEVEEGMEKLNDLTEAEENMGIEGKFRLGCQCCFKGEGKVKIKID
jgi:ferredoxin